MSKTLGVVLGSICNPVTNSSPSVEMAFQIAHVVSEPLEDVFQYPYQEEAS